MHSKSDENTAALLRAIPALGKVLETTSAKELATTYGQGLLKYEVRQALDALRQQIKRRELSSSPQASDNPEVPDVDQILLEVAQRLQRKRSVDARAAVNATGVLLHTNLGRAPIANKASELIASTAGYGVVQVNLEDNSRSKRDEEIVTLLQALTGCQAATVVNNNAAATFMLLNSLCAGQEVVISRGQLVEIGGSFRMPDVMAQSGAILREVGTTNRTHLADYERAISAETAALLYVDPSNYQVVGFAGFPSLAQLCELGAKHNIPVIADLGSGALVPTEKYGIKHSLTIAEALAMGSTITCSSGDKLIGGPQAGIICGQQQAVAKIRKSPFARMFRVDKLTLTGIEVTLQEFVNGTFEQTIPFYRMLSRPIDELQHDANKLKDSLAAKGCSVTIVDTDAFVGGGSLPQERIPSVALKLVPSKVTAENFARTLRLNIPPVFCRIEDNSLLFDMRTLLDGHLEILIEHLAKIDGNGAAA